MMRSKVPTKTSRPYRYSYFADDLSAAPPFFISSATSEKDDSPAKIQKTASTICDLIRRHPRWENSILTLLPPSTSTIFHPNCISIVIRSLSDSNPLFSSRYLLWLSSSSSTFSLDSDTAGVFLNAIAASRSWRPALYAIRSIRFLGESSVVDPFVFHLCSDTRSIHLDKNLLQDLCDVLEGCSTKLSLVSWNLTLSASLRTGRTDLFRRFYAAMMEDGIPPDKSTAGFLIRALCSDGGLAEAYHVLRNVSRKGIVPDVVSITRLISSFARDGNFGRVSELLHLMIAGGTLPDLFTYHEIIHALCDVTGHTSIAMIDEAYRIFCDLKLRGYACDVFMFTTMINGLCRSGRLKEAQLLWSEMVSDGIQPNHYTYNSLIDGLFKADNVDTALELYDEMLIKGFKESTVTCNTMLSGLCLNGRLADAITLFSEMPVRGIDHDLISYNTLIQGLCKGNRTSDAFELYSSLLETGMKPSVSTYTPLIMAMCEEGRVTDSLELVKMMEAEGLEPLVCSYECIIAGFCRIGDSEKGMEWLSKMLERRSKPKAKTMSILVEGLCSMGLGDEALQVVKSMLGMSYTLEPSVCHLLISKLCRVDSDKSGLILCEIMAMESKKM